MNESSRSEARASLSWTLSRIAACLATLVMVCLAASSSAEAAEEKDALLEDPTACREGDRAAVLFFILGGCPIANSTIPEMNRITADYGPKQVRFTFVHVDPGLTSEERDAHGKAFALAAPAMVDVEHRWVRKTGVQISPEAAVFLPDGTLAYRGRINDLYARRGLKRQVVATHDLRRALDALLEGKEKLPPADGEPIGCYIADLAPEKE